MNKSTEITIRDYWFLNKKKIKSGFQLWCLHMSYSNISNVERRTMRIACQENNLEIAYYN